MHHFLFWLCQTFSYAGLLRAASFTRKKNHRSFDVKHLSSASSSPSPMYSETKNHHPSYDVRHLSSSFDDVSSPGPTYSERKKKNKVS